MSSCVHQHHTKQHNVARYTTDFRIMDLDGCDRSNLSFLHIEEALHVS